MKLYWTPASPFVRKVMVTAIELGLDDRIEIRPTIWPHEWGSQTIRFDEDFVAANPIGRIPTLVTDEGIAIPESTWICDYLFTLAPGHVLIPKQDKARWTSIRTLALADGALEAMIARRAESLRKDSTRSDSFLGKQRDRIARCLDAIERDISTLDGELSMAQISTGIACSYMDFRYPEDGWRTARPHLAAWYELFKTRPSMQRTEPAETPQK